MAYGKFEPNEIVALHKICDVYDNFCRARALLVESDGIYANNRDVDDDSKLFFKSMLLLSALVHYVISWDLSWQVVWFRFIEGADIRLITDVDFYNKELLKCTREALLKELQKVDCGEILTYIEAQNKNLRWKNVRDLYNHYKHRGSVHIKGLGENPCGAKVKVNGILPHLLIRREFDVREWTEELIAFNREFIDYFDKIIGAVLPNDYFKTLDERKTLMTVINLKKVIISDA